MHGNTLGNAHATVRLKYSSWKKEFPVWAGWEKYLPLGHGVAAQLLCSHLCSFRAMVTQGCAGISEQLWFIVSFRGAVLHNHRQLSLSAQTHACSCPAELYQFCRTRGHLYPPKWEGQDLSLVMIEKPWGRDINDRLQRAETILHCTRPGLVT